MKSFDDLIVDDYFYRVINNQLQKLRVYRVSSHSQYKEIIFEERYFGLERLNIPKDKCKDYTLMIDLLFGESEFYASDVNALPNLIENKNEDV